MRKSIAEKGIIVYNTGMDTFIFDLYNTLLKIRTDEQREATWRPVVEFFEERGIPTKWETLRDYYSEFWASMMKEREAEKRFAYPEGDIAEVFRRIATAHGAEMSRETCEEAARCMRRASRLEFELFPGTAELLVRLKSLGAKLYLLSNAQAAFTLDEIEECGLTSKLDGILLSSDCGCRKPDPAFFAMLFDKYGLNKSTAVMVGDDRESDGKGAKSFGIKYICAEGGAAAVGAKLIKAAQGK